MGFRKPQLKTEESYEASKIFATSGFHGDSKVYTLKPIEGKEEFMVNIKIGHSVQVLNYNEEMKLEFSQYIPENDNMSCHQDTFILHPICYCNDCNSCDGFNSVEGYYTNNYKSDIVMVNKGTSEVQLIYYK